MDEENLEDAFQTGLLAEQRGDEAEAERWYRRAADGEHTGGLLNLGRLVETTDEDAAIGRYRRAWAKGEDRAAFNIGRLCDNRGDLATAAEWFTRAADEHRSPAAARKLAGIFSARGDTARAEEWTRLAETYSRPSVEIIGATWRP